MTASLTGQPAGTATRDQARAVFAQTMGFVVLDLQRPRRNADISAAPLLAASIFLDILNVFLFFLTIFSGGSAGRE